MKHRKTIKLETPQRPTIHGDLSHASYFANYDEKRDGRVLVATYSFSDVDISFWGRMAVGSMFLIGNNIGKQRISAENLAKRFPWFEVRLVSGLHTKAVLFELSGQLLLGSQNFYGNNPDFAEVSVELLLSAADKGPIKALLFGRHSGKLLSCAFEPDSLKIWDGGVAHGRPFLPCHLEIHHWESLMKFKVWDPDKGAGIRTPAPVTGFHFLYGVESYELGGKLYHAAINRGFEYCGDVSREVVELLIQLYETELQEPPGGILGKYPSHYRASKQARSARVVRRHFFHSLKVPQIDEALLVRWETLETCFKRTAQL